MNASTEALRAAAASDATEGPVASVEAIEAIYRTRAPGYRRLAAAVAGGDVAGDIVQDAFAQALRKRGRWRGDGPLEAWLSRLVLNAARDAARRRVRRERLARRLVRVFEGNSTPPPSVDDGLHAPMRRLPARQRDCVVLRYHADLSYAEIAVVMSIEVGSVGALLSKAHAALRAELSKEEAR
jgi:RNA polymerase sigma-70 factor, ECF subfamily